MSKLILILFPVVVLGAGYGAAVMGFVKVPGVKAAHSSRAGYAADAEDPMLRTLKDQITGLRKQLVQARRSGASGASPSGDSAASGTAKLAKLWNRMEPKALAPVAAGWRPDELAAILSKMDPERAAALLSLLPAGQAKKVSEAYARTP